MAQAVYTHPRPPVYRSKRPRTPHSLAACLWMILFLAGCVTAFVFLQPGLAIIGMGLAYPFWNICGKHADANEALVVLEAQTAEMEKGLDLYTEDRLANTDKLIAEIDGQLDRDPNVSPEYKAGLMQAKMVADAVPTYIESMDQGRVSIQTPHHEHLAEASLVTPQDMFKMLDAIAAELGIPERALSNIAHTGVLAKELSPCKIYSDDSYDEY